MALRILANPLHGLLPLSVHSNVYSDYYAHVFSLVAQTVKKSACNVGDLGLIPGLGRSPGGGHGNLLQYSCLENSHGQRSLVGYSPWSCKEFDTTKQLSTQS